MSEKTAKKTRKLKNETKKMLIKINNKKNKLIEKAIKSFMEKNNLKINDLKSHGTLIRENKDTEIYKYKDEIIIKIKIIYSKKEITIKAESKEFEKEGNLI